MPHRLRKMIESKASRKGGTQAQEPLRISLEKELQNDLIILKRMDSITQKAAYKRERIDRYLPWALGQVESGSGAEDRVLSYMLLWSIDTAEAEPFIKIARYMLEHELHPPFETKLPTFIADNTREQIEKISLDHLRTIVEMIKEEDVNDQAHAKLLRAVGERIEEEAGEAMTLLQKQEVAHLFKRAVTYYEKIGVAKRLERLTEEIEAELAEQ